MIIDTPDVIHGRMKEGAHIAGYSLQRAMENLRWLLEDSRFEQLASGYNNVNDFLRDTQDAFTLLNIKPEERKQIAELVKELQPKASQRAIGDLMGVSKDTVANDLGYVRENGDLSPEINKDTLLNGDFSPPAIPPDDYDPIKPERRKQEKEKKKQERETNLNELIDKAALIKDDDRYTLLVSPVDELSEHIDPDSIDAIITDPPYPKEYIHTYFQMAEQAATILKPGGILVALAGHPYTHIIIDGMSEYLKFHWLGCYYMPTGSHASLPYYSVSVYWKPLLIFSKGNWPKTKTFRDVIINDEADKRYHEWGQGITGYKRLIEAFTMPNDTVLDPFVGGGTTAIAAMEAGRYFIGSDISSDEVSKTRGRLSSE